MKLFQYYDLLEGSRLNTTNALIQLGKKYQSTIDGPVHNGYYVVLRSPFVKKDQLIVSPHTFEVERSDTRDTLLWSWRRFRNTGKLQQTCVRMQVPINY